jgi:broad specificity phosphatase PhoE
MAAQDRSAARRALRGLDPDYRPSRRSRLTASFALEGIGAAVRSDPDLLREALRSFHMLAPPNDWAKRPSTLGKAARAWVAGRFRPNPARPGAAGPRRAEMFDRLGLSPRADLDRVRAAA